MVRAIRPLPSSNGCSDEPQVPQRGLDQRWGGVRRIDPVSKSASSRPPIPGSAALRMHAPPPGRPGNDLHRPAGIIAPGDDPDSGEAAYPVGKQHRTSRTAAPSVSGPSQFSVASSTISMTPSGHFDRRRQAPMSIRRRAIDERTESALRRSPSISLVFTSSVSVVRAGLGRAAPCRHLPPPDQQPLRTDDFSIGPANVPDRTASAAADFACQI